MNKKRTPHTAMVKYLLLIPLFAFAWIGLHAGEITRTLNGIKYITDSDTVKTDTITVVSVGSIRTDTTNIVYKTISVHGKAIANDFKEITPLYIVDGKEIESVNMQHLSPDDIESITVLKNQTAIKLYGEKAKNGVIVVSTKKISERENETAVEDAQQTRIIVRGQAKSVYEVKREIEQMERKIQLLQKQIQLQQEELKQMKAQLKQQQEQAK